MNNSDDGRVWSQFIEWEILQVRASPRQNIRGYCANVNRALSSSGKRRCTDYSPAGILSVVFTEICEFIPPPRSQGTDYIYFNIHCFTYTWAPRDF
jgi:hypothetical protein